MRWVLRRGKLMEFFGGGVSSWEPRGGRSEEPLGRKMEKTDGEQRAPRPEEEKHLAVLSVKINCD